jgi:exopolyphosphatase/pppGpp-phosphohydrolase
MYSGAPSSAIGSGRHSLVPAGERAYRFGMTTPNGPQRREAILAAARELAEEYGADDAHARQVTRLALRLFDELQALHGLGDRERFWLQCAGLLHDIGLSAGAEGHHKTSLRLILRDTTLPFVGMERGIVASVARYHRKALPGDQHEHFGELPPSEREVVRALAGILRVADGLDRTHRDVVTDVACDVSAEELVLRCTVGGPAEAELAAAKDKADLMEKTFGRKVRLVAGAPADRPRDPSSQ